MKITLQSTEQIVRFRGVECRVWQGETERDGTPIYALIARVAVPAEEDQAQFQRELEEQPHAALAIDFRLII